MNKTIQFLPLVEEILCSKCEDAKPFLCNQVPLGIENTAGCSSPASQLPSVKVIVIFVFVQWKAEKTLCACLYQFNSFSRAVIPLISMFIVVQSD